MTGRSVRDLAEEVDQALGRLAQARGLEASCEDALRLAQADVAKAQQEVAAARDALFQEHPALRPDNSPPPFTPRSDVPVAEHEDPSKFEHVDVDDTDDPRFTAGVVTVSPKDDEPLPPIEWGEHDA